MPIERDALGMELSTNPRIEFSAQLAVVDEPDVLVCGAGCAGVGAAIAAAESGARVLVVESSGFPGGFITAVTGPGLDGMYDVVTGEIVVGGVAKDIMEEVSGISREEQARGRFTYGGDLTAESGVDPHKSTLAGAMKPIDMNPEHFKRYVDTRFSQLGIKVLYHTRVVSALSHDGRVGVVALANKGGLSVVRPRYVIDCSGDADIAAWVGEPVATNANPQPMSLHFRLGNVDITDSLVQNCSAALRDGAREGIISSYGGPWLLKMGPRDITVNATRIAADRTDPWQWTRAEIDGRKQAWAIFQLWRERVPECADAYYITSGPEAGARETRRLIGKHTLSVDDIDSRRRFKDAVVQGAWYFDRHSASASGFHSHSPVRPYDIPYRTLVPQFSNNLLVAGRCHSVTPEALASSRVTATAMGMGEGAGTAVGIALQDGIARLADVPSTELRRSLLERGAILEDS